MMPSIKTIWVIIGMTLKIVDKPLTLAMKTMVLTDHIFKLYGMPHSIVSNQDPTFTSNFWREIFHS
jgi:hypothetical protein